ncbi:hypothetical protein CJF32_00008006 [Rutstroemia sp. NJR-2017a WRK4]|nr:hypothetical protein CJF32_00008006 [Rutstroemia sp. NJR-2017a WRK4]
MGYETSLRQWASALEKGVGKWYLGAPAWSQAGPTAYASIGGAKEMKKVVSDVVDQGFSNFGGVMFWAGPEAQANTEGGKDIIAWAKDGLTN